MKRVLLASAFTLAVSPAFAAGSPPAGLSALNLPPSATAALSSLQPGAASLPPALPLAPVVVDLGASTPGLGSPFHFAPPTSELPGLADLTTYADNTGTGGRFNGDVEVDTFGQKSYPTVNVYGLAFTDPPKHPLHLVGNLAGIPVDQRFDAPQ